MRRTPRGLALALLCAMAAPAAARAQAAPDQPPPPGTIVLGSLTLTPGLTIKEIGVDDNVFNDAENPKSDFTFTLTPRAAVALRLRRLRLSYQTVTDYVYFQTYTSERGMNATSEARADLDLGRLRPYVSIGGANTRSRLNAEVDARARHHDRTYVAGAALRIASRTNVTFAARRTSMEYEPDSFFRGVSLQHSFDGRLERLEAGLGVDLTPITTFSVVGHAERQRFDLSPQRDSESWRVTPTLTFSPLGLLTGTVSVGYRQFDASDPTLPDYTGLVASAGIGATIYNRHQLQASYLRDVQYSYDDATPYYLANGGSITWTTIVAGPFDVRGSAGFNRLHYRGAALDTDRLSLYGGGVGYRFTEQARLGGTVEWTRRESDRSHGREYRNRRIFASLTWGAAQ